VELFVERARRQRSDFEPRQTEAEAVKEVVRLTEGMPLAIELAASRVRILTVAQVVERMRERFRILGGSGGGRHASLKVAIDGSWELLQEWEKAAFAQCSVFEGGFTLDAAEHVLDLTAWPEAPWTIDVVQSLVDKSLVRASTLGATSTGSVAGVRFGLSVNLLEYARMKLRGEGSDAVAGSGPDAERAAEVRHGEYYARYGTEAAGTVRERIEEWRPLDLELDNLMGACRRAAVRGDGEVVAAAYRSAWLVLELRGPFGAAVELGRAALCASQLGRKETANVVRTLGHAEWYAGMIEEARAHLETALALARELGDQRLVARVLGNLGGVHFSQGRVEEAILSTEEALAAARAIGDRRLEGSHLGNLSVMRRDQGRMEEAVAAGELALAIARSAGDRRGEGTTLGNLGLLQHDLGRTAEARTQYEAALAIHREVGDRRYEGATLTYLADLLHHQGAIEAARNALASGEQLLRQVGARLELGELLFMRAEFEVRDGNVKAAEATLAEAEALAVEFGSGPDSVLGRGLAKLRRLLPG
jgi:tetratricopeptide (TPR) repeat protein